MVAYLKRYTDIMSLTDILVNKRITLLPTTAWKDENDRRAMEIFKERAKHKAVAALCMTRAAETFHHWELFSSGPSGVCIQFDAAKFEALFSDQSKFAVGPVEYLTLNQLKEAASQRVILTPFVKRKGYWAEKEFRVIGFADVDQPTIAVDFDLSIIKKIVFSPFTNETLFQSAKAALWSLDGCKHIRWSRSTLIKSDVWLQTLESFPDFVGLSDTLDALSRLVNEAMPRMAGFSTANKPRGT
jgi:hypothetical protein